jgi:hypothetical protein
MKTTFYFISFILKGFFVSKLVKHEMYFLFLFYLALNDKLSTKNSWRDILMSGKHQQRVGHYKNGKKSES